VASGIYNSFMDDLAEGRIDLDTDTFYIMLLDSGYTPNKDTHNRRDDIEADEVPNGSGYTTGGQAVTVTCTLDTANDREDVSFTDLTWTSSTITARYAAIYKRRGGASSADELVCWFDFGGDISTTGGTFSVDFTTPLRFSNP
jgi:hypothetical protein